MSSLSAYVLAQIYFTRDLSRLLDYAIARGLLCVVRECYRPPVMAWINSMPSGSRLEIVTASGAVHLWDKPVGGVGIQQSRHCDGLAADILIYRPDGRLSESLDDYSALGDYWEDLRVGNKWGGHFQRRDIFHFQSSPL